jgi:hypothetical protein
MLITLLTTMYVRKEYKLNALLLFLLQHLLREGTKYYIVRTLPILLTCVLIFKA